MTTVNIKAIRHKLGLSQEALAHLLGVSFGTISRWERGKAKPSPLATEKIKTLIQEKVKKCSTRL